MDKPNVLIIGAGGVAQVVAHKVAQWADEFGDIHMANRTQSRADAIVDSIRSKGTAAGRTITTHALDGMDSAAVADLIRATGARIVINVGSPFINNSVLQGCIDAGAAYIDTAIHEDPDKVCETPPWYANHEWKRREDVEAAGITAILGAGFDPGVVNAYARLAEDEYFDEITSIDIVDINAGSHGRWFATNFDPEINFREFTGTVYSWQGGEWRENAMFEVGREWDLPVVGKQTAYLAGHDEVHSLSARYAQADVRFWMGFGPHYINVFTVLKNLGLLSEKPVRTAEGQEVVPLKVVKAVLPDPASLAPDYTGKTCIGDLVRGIRDGKDGEVFIYNVADHREAYDEVGSQGISYTAGVPPVAAAILIARGDWDVKRMVNVEDLPARPFLELLGAMGLPTRVIDASGDNPV